MGIVSKLAKAGVAKRLITEAKKPQNQAKAKEAFAKLRSKQGTRAPR